MGVKFRNFLDTNLRIYYDDKSANGVFSGNIRANGGYSATNSYTTHTLMFRTDEDPKTEVTRFTMRPGKNMYVIHPKSESGKQNKEYKELLKEIEFTDEYRERTGRPWLQVPRRAKPKHNIWATDYMGQIHKINSKHSYQYCDPSAKGCVPNTKEARLEPAKLEHRAQDGFPETLRSY